MHVRLVTFHLFSRYCLAPELLVLSATADDAIAILAAFNTPEEIHIVGMTTIYGNVPTSKATQNAVRLRELAGQEQVTLQRLAAAVQSLGSTMAIQPAESFPRSL